MIDDFESCPVGIKNSLEIKHVKEDMQRTRDNFDLKLDAMMQRIEEKIDSMNDKIQLEFDQLKEQISKMDKKVAALDKKMEGVDSLESFVEGKIDDSTKNKVFNFVRWVVVALVGGTCITILGKVVASIVGV